MSSTTTRDDLHALTDRLLLNKETVTPQERRLAKKTNYGVMYGMVNTDIHRLLEDFPNG